MDRKEDSKHAYQTGQGNRNLKITMLICIIVSAIIGTLEVYNSISHLQGKELCNEWGYDELIRFNMNSIYCAKWINITFAGIKNDYRQDDIYYNVNGEWVIIESYQHGIGEVDRGELMN